MTNIQNHVTSLELSKRLKDLGVKQESEFAWCLEYGSREEFIVERTEGYAWGMHPGYKEKAVCSAFLASELGEMLPEGITIWKQIFTEDMEMEWRCEKGLLDKETKSNNEPDARAKMLIYLLENNLLPVNDVNKHHV